MLVRVKIFYFIIVLILLFPYQVYPCVVIDKIVAVVGKSYLTLYELEEMAKPFYKKYLTDNLPPNQKEIIKKKIQKELLEKWIEDTIIENEAKKYGFSVSEEEVEKYLEFQIKKIGGEENFKKFLKSQNITLNEYKDQIKKELLKIKFIQFYLHKKIVITEHELKTAYKEFLKNYDKTPKYVLSVVNIKGDLNTVMPIYERIGKGDLQDVCNLENVECIKSIVIKENELAPKILKRLQKIKEGEITFPIKREDNFYQVFKLIKRISGTPPSFDEVREFLYKEIFAKKAQKFLDKWIQNLRFGVKNI